MKAAIALGSNLGRRRSNLRDAIDWLGRTPGITVIKVADAIETQPVDCPPGANPFLNSAAIVQTTLTPIDLLHSLFDIERKLGRVRRTKNDSRPIDLDLILYDDLIQSDESLTIPHPRMHERLFVLAPLAQIAPDWNHPTLKKTIKALLDELIDARQSPVGD